MTTPAKRVPVPLQLSGLVAAGTLLIALIQLFFIVRFVFSMQTVTVGGALALPYAALAGRVLFAVFAGLVLVSILRFSGRAAARLSLALFALLAVFFGANIASTIGEQSGPEALPQTGFMIVLATRAFWILCLFWIGLDVRKLAAAPSR